LHRKLEQLPGVSEVTSLINAEKITGIPDGIEISPLIDTAAINIESLKLAAAQTQSDPMFEGVYVSADQHVAALIISLPGMFSGGSDSLCKAFYAELTMLVVSEKASTGRTLHIGGDIVTDTAVEQLMDRDLSRLFPFALLFSAIVLLVFYRRFITTLVPLAPVLVAILWVLGLKGWTNIPMTPISVTLFPLIMVIGLANSIHIINSYRKIRCDFSTSYEAMRETLKAVLKPCFLAAFTTTIGFGSLLVSDVTGISQMGIFAAFGVLSAFFLSVVIIPSALIGSQAFSTEKPVERNQLVLEPLLQRISWLNQNHPWKVLAFFAVVTLLMALYIPKIKVEGSMASFAKEKPNSEATFAFRILKTLGGIITYELEFSKAKKHI
jgi:predicted RND superfamily exporter protein